MLPRFYFHRCCFLPLDITEHVKDIFSWQLFPTAHHGVTVNKGDVLLPYMLQVAVTRKVSSSIAGILY